MGDDQVGEG